MMNRSKFFVSIPIFRAPEFCGNFFSAGKHHNESRAFFCHQKYFAQNISGDLQLRRTALKCVHG
jgi:hypothetical protein